MTANANDILSHVDPAEVVRLTQQLIAIPSPVWDESEVAKWIAAWFAERRYSVDLQEISLRNGKTTHNVIGKLAGNGSGASLMLCGHTDTSDWNGRRSARKSGRTAPIPAMSPMACCMGSAPST